MISTFGRWAVLLGGFLLATGGCVRKVAHAPDGVLVVAQEQQASFVRNFNPLTTASSPRWPTYAGVYETILVFNSVKNEYVPWLVTEWEWLNENLTLRMRAREGVRWSDGETFTAEDIVFTLNLQKEFPALDGRGVWDFLTSVELVDEYTLDCHFQRVYIPGLDELAPTRPVPQHVWSHLEDPVTFSNENPVATGPFTEINVFRNQVFEVGRNPYYWQPGKPHFEAIRCPAYPSNDRANLALVFDEVDWAANFIPAVERVFVERDPEHHKYWFPLTGSTVFLYAQTQRAPFDDIRVRKALSMGIDRQLLVDVAAFRYSRPCDATALSDAYTSWHDPDALASGDWTKFDLEQANALLDEAGHARGADGRRRLPDGEIWDYEILTVSGWSDWVRAAQVIARGFQELGIDARVKTYDFSAWFQRVREGRFDLSLGWSFEGPTPYLFYRWLMSSVTVKPEGTPSHSNWHRFGSDRADANLEAFENEPTLEGQRQLSDEMQRIFVEEVPAIPLYPNPSWATYNERRFQNFPSPSNPYADPSPNKVDRGEVLLVLTNIQPR